MALALDPGTGHVCRFKDALLDYPALRERWFVFRDARAEQRMLDWLEVRGIELLPENPCEG